MTMSTVVILHLFMDYREVTGWTNAVGSIEAINKMLLFQNILHFNMNLMK